MPRTCFNRHLHELRIASSKPIFCDTNVVFEAGPHRSASSCQHPIHHFRLVPPDAGRRPSRIRKNALKLAMQKIEDALLPPASAFFIPMTN